MCLAFGWCGATRSVAKEGPVPVLKWDLGLFEQIVRSFRFPPEWDARYPAQGQIAADAPPGYITLYEDLFLQGNFRLPATNFMGSILHHYNFHLSQMSPPGMVRVRHFEFLCRSHGIEPTVEKFRAFYQLQRTMGFFSFASRGAAKKILLNPPKSFHDWKPKFFFIREEVLPIAMPFRDWTEPVLKEDLPIPKQALWYQQLTPTPNRVFGENVLVAARMSDQWSPDSKEVPVLKIGDQEAQLYQAAFATFGGSMGVRPLREDEESWYEKIRGNFMYPVADAFTSPPTATEGAQFPKPRPLRSVTSAYLSSEECVTDLGIDPEEKKKKPLKKKKTVNVDPEVTRKGAGSSRASAAAVKGTLRLRQSDLNDYVIISDSLKGLSRTTDTKTGAGSSRSSGSAGSRNPDTGATPSVHEEDEAEEEEAAVQLVSRKRVRSETTAGVSAAPLIGGVPLVGKTSNLRSLYKFSPEIKKKTPEKGVKFTEPEPKRPKITKDAAKAVEAQRKAEERQKKVEEEKKRKAEEDKRKKAEEEKRAEEAKKKRAFELEKEREQKKALEKPIIVQEFEVIKGSDRRQEPEVVKPTHHAHAETHDRSKIVTSKGWVERGDAPHQAPWSLKQKDTFQEFGPCRDWFLNSFTPGEVNRQRAKTHEMLYRTYVLGEANARAANHQIVREWRTMVRERADWEGYREWMLKRITDFEKSKAAFDEEKAKFDADKKAEEWGREGLKNKLQAAEQQLAKEKAEFKRICEKDNERAFTARNKIVELEAKIAELTARVEDAQVAQVAKQQIEVELADTKMQLSSKDKDLHAKDVEIVELKRRLNEQIDRCESLEIDLEAERVKAATAEEARAVSAAALNVAQTNYSEAQGIVDTLVSEAEWMRGRGVVLVANSILNAGELDRAVAALTDVARGRLSRRANVELTRAESAYDNLSLPVIDLVVEALKRDDWCQRLKAILDPPVTVELSDEEETAGDDGGNGDDDGGNDDDGDQHDELE
ncbi:hypothetical protein HanPI659440_Chr13g0513731 [Helianthus annuus]|nr:hypothetical protein HanPI659440_Chr13g0513731 [Helianthus annuus]